MLWFKNISFFLCFNEFYDFEKCAGWHLTEITPLLVYLEANDRYPILVYSLTFQFNLLSILRTNRV